MVQHRKGKNHKRRSACPVLLLCRSVFHVEQALMLLRLRFLREEPYTQKEAEAAVGLRTDNGQREGAKSEADKSSLPDHGIMEIDSTKETS